jgi:transposase
MRFRKDMDEEVQCPKCYEDMEVEDEAAKKKLQRKQHKRKQRPNAKQRKHHERKLKLRQN